MTGLAHLCWVIAAGRLIAGSSTLRRMSAHRQEQATCLTGVIGWMSKPCSAFLSRHSGAAAT